GDSDLASEARGADSLIRGIATGGIRQQKIFLGIDIVKQRFFAAVEVNAANCDGNHVGAAGFEGARGFLKGFIFPRADDQAGAESTSGDYECVAHAVIVMKTSGERA